MPANSERNEIPEIPPHLPYLDGLRGLAALYVVLHHALLQAVPNPPLHAHNPLELAMRLLLGGRYAVDLFIVLSGFSLMLPVLRNGGELSGGIWKFYLKRAKRILPPYYATLAISLLLIAFLIGKPTGTHWDGCLPVTWKGIVTHLLLLQDLFTDTSGRINHTLWSISVEWRVYLLFPVALWLWKRINPLNAAFAILFVSYAIFAIPTGAGLDIMAISPHYFGLFALGMLAAETCYSRNNLAVQLRKGVYWKSISAVLALLAMTQGWRAPWFLEDLLIGVASACLLVGLSLSQKHPANLVLTWKPIVFLGSFAYSIYLFHAPILQIFSQYLAPHFHLDPNGQFLLSVTCGTAFSLVCSYVFYLTFEKPSLSYRSKPHLGLATMTPSPVATATNPIVASASHSSRNHE